LGVTGAVLGPTAALAYGVLEATLGPTQNKPGVPDDPVLAIASILLVTLASVCQALTMRGLHARYAPRDARGLAPRLHLCAVILLTITGLLWIPLWLGEYAWRMLFGPFVGLVMAVGMLSLLLGVLLTGLWALRNSTLPVAMRPVPLVLLVLMSLIWALISLAGPWRAVALLFVPFLASWLLLGVALWWGRESPSFSAQLPAERG
jgi:hypothetical protein